MEAASSDLSLATQSRVPEVIAILSVGCVLSTVVVTLRLATRLWVVRAFWWDDGLIGFAQLLVVGSAIAIGLETKWGLGHHVGTVQPEETIPYLKAFYSSIVVYNVAVGLVKISIMLQYRRIFSGPIMKHLTLYFLAFLVAWCITLAFLLSLVCVPVAAFWDHTIHGRCLDFLSIWYTIAIINLVTDFAIFSIPLPVVKSLRLPQKQKIMLFLIFGIGFITCVISAIRLATLRAAAETTDPTWDNVNAATWSFIELCTGVLAASLPTLRPLLGLAMPRVFGSLQSGASTSHNHHSRQSRGDWSSTEGPTSKMPVIKESESREQLHPGHDIKLSMEDLRRNHDVEVVHRDRVVQKGGDGSGLDSRDGNH